MDESELREKLADYAHRAWSGWMDYLFSKGYLDQDYNYIIPAAFVKRWGRQTKTAYVNLPENEKDSDRKEADDILAIVRPAEDALRAQLNVALADADRLAEAINNMDGDLQGINAESWAALNKAIQQH